MGEEAKRRAMRVGTRVFVGLAVLDAIEYWVAVVFDHVLVWMVVLALPQAWLIVRYFMHIQQVRGEA